MSLRPISESLPRLTGSVFSRKYISLGRIVTHWREIVGPDVAMRTQPVKLRYRKAGANGAMEAALDVAAGSADAALLQYRVGILLEKINTVFGNRLVTSIRFVHSPANVRGVPARRERPLSDAEKARLAQTLALVEDADMKEKLQSLGASILAGPGHRPAKERI